MTVVHNILNGMDELSSDVQGSRVLDTGYELQIAA